MIVIAIPFGITIDPAGLVVTLALVGLIGLAMAPLSYSAALVLKSEDAFAPVVQFIALPLLLLSGIFLPLQLAPELAPDAGGPQPGHVRGRCRASRLQRHVG